MDSWTDPAVSEDELSRRRHLIAEAVEQYGEDLIVSARLFAVSLGLPDPGETPADVAEEIVQATVVRALEIAGSFDPTRPARPWLSAVLANVTKEERRRRYRYRRTTTSIRSAARLNQVDGAPGEMSDDDLLDRLRRQKDETDPAAGIHLDDLLGLVSDRDGEVLRLSVIEDLSGRDVAAHLGISEGAAYVRLHRALRNLRTAYGRWDESMKRAN